jgi:hypothetical protein
MFVDVFRGTGRVYAITESGVGMSKLPKRYGPWTAFKTIELVKGQPTPSVHVEECLADLAQFGIHVTDAHSRITEEAIK